MTPYSRAMAALTLLVVVAAQLLTPSWCAAVDYDNAAPENSTGNKDMYVIHAMVYQVGILTNSTDEDEENSTLLGNEEALTFFHTNGSKIDLSKIPASLLTNVTGQSFVGVAPVGQPPDPAGASNLRMLREVGSDGEGSSSESTAETYRNLWPFKTYAKRSSANDHMVKILNGTSIIPEEASVQSVGIPPLLSFNNNLSEIPVPIPNTSVVQYSKINTLIRPANSSQV